MTDKIRTYDINQIIKIVPHRYPFLLVDHITECVTGKYAKGYKNVTYNEPFFEGHFPENPIMPGVMQIEAMAQCAAAIFYETFKNKLALFAGIENARFKNIVRPGDKLEFVVTQTKAKGPIVKVHGIGTVDGNIVVEADLTLCIK